MSTHHEGTIQMIHLFNEAWSFVKKEEGINLKTEREKTPFRAEAKYTTRGKHKGEKVIIFYQKNEEYARSYPCCWGHRENCNRTWIGMYCKALDNFIP